MKTPRRARTLAINHDPAASSAEAIQWTAAHCQHDFGHLIDGPGKPRRFPGEILDFQGDVLGQRFASG
jgi:hypothetical protein